MEMGVSEAEQEEEEEEKGNNEMEGEISEDEVPPVQRRTRGGRVIRRPDFFQAGGK